MKIIYDLGANDGNNIPYYLLKADTVIAVEANPMLAAKINVSFSKEIAAGRLFVVNAVLIDVDADADVNFYLHKFGKDKHGQFPRPAPDKIDNYEVVKLPSITIVDLINKFGQPHYIKIDIEYMDEKILKQLFLANIFPPYISAESHSIDVFSTLVTLGNYRSFNLVDGPSVSKNYGKAKIRSKVNPESMTQYAFPPESGGPFGEDISSPWMVPDNFFQLLALEGLGWKDIHASREIVADPSNKIRFSDYVKRYLLKKIIP